MTVPTTVRVRYENGGLVSIPDVTLTPAVAASLIALPNSLSAEVTKEGDSLWSLVAWNGHEFELVKAHFHVVGQNRIWINLLHQHDLAEASMDIYYPIDERIIESDVLRATEPYKNETNTGWLFRHCDADAMIDYEHELSAAIVAQFAPELDAAQVKVNEATNVTIRNQAVANHIAIVEFRDAAVDAVVAWTRTLHIGWQEQNPHEAHVHLPALRAIQSVVTDWQTNRAADYRKVSSRVGRIIKSISGTHDYETRWDKAARLEAERKAAEAEAETETEGAGD